MNDKCKYCDKDIIDGEFVYDRTFEVFEIIGKNTCEELSDKYKNLGIRKQCTGMASFSLMEKMLIEIYNLQITVQRNCEQIAKLEEQLLQKLTFI